MFVQKVKLFYKIVYCIIFKDINVKHILVNNVQY